MQSIELSNPVFKLISQAAEMLNLQAFVIGGFVRDIILKRNSKDIDIVVAGSGIELAEKVAELTDRKGKVNVFKNFGTASFSLKDFDVEFVGARKESYRRDSRNPIVENGSLIDDQNRRDFTINAMAICLNKDRFGELIDPFDGIGDISRKIIKTPLNPIETFSDDPLRMLRAIRFVTQLDFELDQKACNAIASQCSRIEIISKERITDELTKILASNRPSKGFELLLNTGLLSIIFPELYNLKGIEVIKGKKHKDNFFHTLEVVDNIAVKSDNIWLRWAGLLHDIGKPLTKKFDPNVGWTFHGHDFVGYKMVKSIFKNLKLPLNEKLSYVEKLVQLHLRPIVLSEDIVTDSAIRRLLFDAGDEIDDLMLLCEADITSKNPNKVKKYLNNFEVVREKLKEIEEKDKLRNWQPPISGELIMKTFGINPSREVGIIKTAIREAIIEGTIQNDFNEAFEFMLQEGKKIGLIRVE